MSGVNQWRQTVHGRFRTTTHRRSPGRPPHHAPAWLRVDLFWRAEAGHVWRASKYDVTSTYFEGQAAGNPQAKRGHSRDHRPDCKQVCIALVVTRQGIPLGYEVFDGNRVDVTT